MSRKMVVAPFIVVVVLAAAWSAFWFYAASAAETKIANWREQQAKLGRVYRCSSQTIGGYPFRIEVRCAEPSVELTGAGSPVVFTAKDAVIVAQVYQPTLLIGEFTGPLTVAEGGQPASLVANWSLAQASLRGLPTRPERISVTLQAPTLDRVTAAGSEPLAKADRLELHARLAAGSISDNPVIDLAAQLSAATAPVAGPLAARPFDANVVAVLRGLKDLKPKPVRTRLQEFQAAGGRLDITSARLQQGESVAVVTGELGLTARGRLDGTLRMTVAGIDQFIAANGGMEKLAPLLGLDRVTASVGGLDRLGPVLGGLDRLASKLGTSTRERAQTGLLGLLGQQAELDGKRAVAIPLRFTDGTTFLGPFRVGEVAAVY